MNYIGCPDCDLIMELPVLRDGQRAFCPRCNHLLTHRAHRALERSAAFALAALIFLILANLYPFISFEASGHTQVMTLFQSAQELFKNGSEVLSFFVLAFIILFPGFILFSQLLVLVPILLKRQPVSDCSTWARFIFTLGPWSMAEVFILGVLASLIKIASMATIVLGLSFWAYVAFALCFLAAATRLDRYQFWRTIMPFPSPKAASGQTAIRQGLAQCHICTLMSPAALDHCPRCGAGLHCRTSQSLQRTLALLITAGILYLPANMLPITHTDQFGNITDSTIVGSAILMWQHGSYPVSIIIFVASIFIPMAKLFGLGWLCWSVSRSSSLLPRQRTSLYRITEFVGRWSMVDVFVVAILVSLVQLGGILTIRPGPAALAFSGVVIITMFAAESFDPRLIWDKLEDNDSD
ncbi:MAG: PqiA/YebS family transporter subunit [Desulfuromonadales bacterium]|nr:PqiA/YebS family transporter subunit [Desulfuromonadales bacterium]